MQSLFNNSYGCAEYGRQQREIYICRMLTTFEENIDYYKECDEFIKFTDIDIWEIGNSMGFNAFGKTAAEVNFQARMPMSDEYDKGVKNLLMAMKCPEGIGNPFLHLSFTMIFYGKYQG